MKGSLKMWIFASLCAFLGLSLVGLILFILKNREAIDEEIAMSEPIERLSSIREDVNGLHFKAELDL